MRDLQAYKELATVIVTNKVAAFGAVAVRKANAVSGLKVDDKGNAVQIDGDPVAVLDELVLTYERMAGRTSTVLTKRYVEFVLKKYPGLELPPRLAE